MESVLPLSILWMAIILVAGLLLLKISSIRGSDSDDEVRLKE